MIARRLRERWTAIDYACAAITGFAIFLLGAAVYGAF